MGVLRTVIHRSSATRNYLSAGIPTRAGPRTSTTFKDLSMRISIPIAAAFALLTSLPAYAENDYVLFGAGLNLATFSIDPPSGFKKPDQSNRVAPAIQLGYQMGTFSGDATVLSLGYESKGTVLDASGSGDDITMKLNYMQLSFQYKALFGQASGPRFYLAPGIGAALLVFSEATRGSDSRDIDDATSFDLDLAGAFGVQMPMGNNAFLMEAGYGYGLFDVDDTPDSSINNSVIKLRIGFLIGT